MKTPRLPSVAPCAVFICLCAISAWAQNSVIPPVGLEQPLKAYFVSGTQRTSLSGTVSISSSDPTVTGGSRAVQESDLEPLPPYPANAVPSCFYRGPSGWIPTQGQGSAKSEGRIDLAASRLSRSGQLTIGREIDEKPADGAPGNSFHYKSTTVFELETGDGRDQFDQRGEDLSGQYVTKLDASVQQQFTLSLTEATYNCPLPTIQTVLLPDPANITKPAILSAPLTATGIAADGAALVAVVIRAALPGVPVEISFLADGGRPTLSAGAVGETLRPFTSGSTITVQPEVIGGESVAILLLRAPEPYPQLAQIQIADALKLQVRQAGGLAAETSLRIYMPPLITIHGIWSSSRTWSAFVDELMATNYPAARISNFDYEVVNNYAFSSTTIQIGLYLRVNQIIQSCASQGIACAKVDLLGHSMGGLISRYYAERGAHREQVHRIVTVATPHSGSLLATAFEKYADRTLSTGCPAQAAGLALASLIAGFRLGTAVGSTLTQASIDLAFRTPLSELMQYFGRNLEGGGNHSLRPGITEQELGSIASDFRPIAGLAPDETYIESFFNAILKCYGNNETVDGLLTPLHDTTVPVESQLGGRQGPVVSGVIHSSVAGWENLLDRELTARFPGGSDAVELEVLNSQIWSHIRSRFAAATVGFAPSIFPSSPSSGSDFAPLPSIAPAISAQFRIANREASNRSGLAPLSAAAIPYATSPGPIGLGLEDLGRYTLLAASNLTANPPSGTSIELGKDRVVTFQPAKPIKGLIVVGLGKAFYQEITAPPYQVVLPARGSAAAAFSVLALFLDNTYSRSFFRYPVAITGPVTSLQSPLESVELSADQPRSAIPAWARLNGRLVDMGQFVKVQSPAGAERFLSLERQGETGYQVRRLADGAGRIYVSYGASSVAIPVRSGDCKPVMFTRYLAQGAGGLFDLPFTIASSCNWTADHDAGAWITRFDGSGTGPGSVRFQLSPNFAAVPRRFQIQIGDQATTVIQPPAGCQYAISGASRIGLSGGRLTFSVVASGSCGWNTLSNATWVRPDSTGYSFGPGTAVVWIDAAAAPRQTQVFVAGQRIDISQEPACEVIATPPSSPLSAASGSLTLPVLAQTNCGWTASSTAYWLRIRSRPSGSGASTLTLDYDKNTGVQREASISLGGKLVSIMQEAAAAILPAPILASPAVNAASFEPEIAPGGFFTVYGSNLAPTTRIWKSEDFNGSQLPLSLDGVSITIAGKPAYIYFISPGQVNAIAPAFPFEADVPVVVRTGSGSATANARMRSVSPGLFLSSRAKFPLAQFPNGRIAKIPGQGPDVPAIHPGDTIILYGTGFGSTNPPYPEGQILSKANSLSQPAMISIGGKSVAASFAGLIYAGTYQINVKIPADVPVGEVRFTIAVGNVVSSQETYLLIEP